jgi:hypothetical protein
MIPVQNWLYKPDYFHIFWAIKTTDKIIVEKKRNIFPHYLL